MNTQGQTPPETTQLRLVHSLQPGVLPEEPSSVYSAPLYSVDNPDRVSVTVAEKTPATPPQTQPTPHDNRVIDAREIFETRYKAVLAADREAFQQQRTKVSRFLGNLVGPYF